LIHDKLEKGQQLVFVFINFRCLCYQMLKMLVCTEYEKTKLDNFDQIIIRIIN